MNEHSAPPVRSSGTPLQTRPNDPPIEGDTLAVIPLSGGQELRLVRMQDGLLAIDSASNVLQIGTIKDLIELATAMKAVAKTLGPEGGN